MPASSRAFQLIPSGVASLSLLSGVLYLLSMSMAFATIKRIQSGEYAKMFISEGATNYPSMTARRRNNAAHEIETTGAKLRAMMPWIGGNKIIDKDKN